MRTTIGALALTICLSGCASLTEAPKLYGGTRALLERPFPITDASIKLGQEKPLVPGPTGLVLLNLYWIVDFPLSFVMDSLLAPLAYWVFDDHGESSESGGSSSGGFAPAPESAPPTDDPNSIPDDPLAPG